LLAGLVKAHEAEDARQALDVVKQLKAICSAALPILADAREVEGTETARKAVERLHRQIELQAKLLGGLDERPQVDVLVAPEWVASRALCCPRSGRTLKPGPRWRPVSRKGGS